MEDQKSEKHEPDDTCPLPAFAGRVGGNQAFVVKRTIDTSRILHDEPDAAVGMTFAEQMSLRPFRNIRLWKAALLEGCGKSHCSLRMRMHCCR